MYIVYHSHTHEHKHKQPTFHGHTFMLMGRSSVNSSSRCINCFWIHSVLAAPVMNEISTGVEFRFSRSS